MFGIYNNGNNKITRNHITGALVGVGLTVAAYYLYKKNQHKVDSFLKSQGIKIKRTDSVDYESMDLESLVETKEYLEDLIAEKELTEEAPTICDSECPNSKTEEK